MRMSDWSSDVCASDLPALGRPGTGHRIVVEPRPGGDDDLRLQRLLALGFLVTGLAAACLGLFGFGRLQVSWALSVADDCDVVTTGRQGRRTGRLYLVARLPRACLLSLHVSV